MTDFQRVCSVSEVPEGGKIVVEVGDRVVALFHVDGGYFAVDDLCTHDGGPLADGQLDGCTIICPRHGARFDVRTGRALSMPATRDTPAHEVRVEGNDVLVRIVEDDCASEKECREADQREAGRQRISASTTRHYSSDDQ